MRFLHTGQWLTGTSFGVVFLMGDVSLEQAQNNADRVNTLVGKKICQAKQVDALDPDSLHRFLEPVDVMISCVPYWMHPRVAAVAVRAKTHM